MELYQLKTFVTVAQQGHLTQAAEILHLSQPAVTAQIKALEEEIGMPLFERVSGGVTLTRVGQALLPDAQGILSTAKMMLNHAKTLHGTLSGKVKIGVALTPETLKLGAWADEIRTRYPLLNLSFQFGVTGGILNQVRKKELDAGFYLGNNPYSNVFSQKLATLKFVLVAPMAYESKVCSLQPKDLGKLPWIGMSQFSSLSKLTTDLWRELNISPKKETECDNLMVVESMVEAGVGLALIRETEALQAALQRRLVIVPEIEVEADLLFIYPAENKDDPILQALFESLKLVWDQYALIDWQI